MSTCNLAFIVPCYNEEANIPLFCQRVNEVFIDTKIDFEVIFIDDGSTDHTLETLRRIIEVDPQLNFTVLSFSRNFGKEAAILAGLKECCKEKCEYVCIIDADLQQDPQYALQMLDILKSNKGYDCVAAYQETRKEGYVLSKFKNIFYWIINKISDVEFINGASDFRLFHRCVAEAILELPEYQRFTKGIFSWVGFKTMYFPYTVEDRKNGVSTWSFKKLFRYAVEGIISFTTLPLRISAWLGFIVSFVAFLYLIVVILQKILFGIDIAGYPTIIVLILLLGGVQLVVLGVIGEYLAKTFLEVKRRPVYIVKEKFEQRGKM